LLLKKNSRKTSGSHCTFTVVKQHVAGSTWMQLTICNIYSDR